MLILITLIKRYASCYFHHRYGKLRTCLLTLSVPNFRRHLSSAFFILTNFRLERRLYVKSKDWMSNSVDPDETAHWAVSFGSMLFAKAYSFLIEPSHLDLCCLQKPIIIACGSERVKHIKIDLCCVKIASSNKENLKKKRVFKTFEILKNPVIM